MSNPKQQNGAPTIPCTSPTHERSHHTGTEVCAITGSYPREVACHDDISGFRFVGMLSYLLILRRRIRRIIQKCQRRKKKLKIRSLESVWKSENRCFRRTGSLFQSRGLPLGASISKIQIFAFCLLKTLDREGVIWRTFCSCCSILWHMKQ